MQGDNRRDDHGHEYVKRIQEALSGKQPDPIQIKDALTTFGEKIQMCGCNEVGTCSVCGKHGFVERTYFRYDLNGLKCECHSPEHFEIVRHCKDCKPVPPTFTNVQFRTANLKLLP